ncbi:MAG: tryptophan--tRNA ligase [Helicobacteraceae bacterium]|nr:tryptophan--tRNA ligase [Helicobacteraceae bacterium]
MSKKIVFSGIQPTGNIHLGNYLGAIKNWVEMQDLYENIFCIVNSHAITIKQNPNELRQNTLNLACTLLACGIDIEKSSLFVQSDIDEHPALAWILDCNIQMGDMSRMTQFKDKSQKNSKNINVGLFNYPALMAADILLYQADLVPVGADQKQHIELARNVAIKFNRDYGKAFKIPEPLIIKESARIMGLDNPQIKMSKSVKSPNHAIFLLDSNDEIERKIKRATTDSSSNIIFDENRVGIYNLLSIYELLSKKSRSDIEVEFENKGYGDFKKALCEVVINFITPIRDEYLRLQNNKDYVLNILKDGAEQVKPIAKATYDRVKELVGLQ